MIELPSTRDAAKQAIEKTNKTLGLAGIEITPDVTAKELVNTYQSGWDDLSEFPLSNSWFKETTPNWSPLNGSAPFLLYPYRLIMGSMQKRVWGTSYFKPSSSFTLPISPQQLNITTPFAIAITPTLNGIVEEHNSTRFRDIEIAGTMGVFPSRGEMKQRSLGGIGNSILNFTGLRDTFDNVRATLDTAGFADFFKTNVIESDSTAFQNAGYRNLHRMRNFLETYAESKKSDPSLRLVFANYKDQQFYYVTPVSFAVRRSAASPLEYEYQLSMRAWGRFDLKTVQVALPVAHIDRGFSIAKVLAALNGIGYVVNALGSIAPSISSLLTGSASTVLSSILGGVGSAVRSTISAPTSFVRTVQNIGEGLVGLSDILGPEKEELTPEKINEVANSARNINITVSEQMGLISDTFNLVNDRVPAVPVIASPSPEQLDIVFGLNSLTNSLNSLATDEMMAQPTMASPMEYIAGLASKSGIAFQVPVSKYPVPFPYGTTLEHLSARYLNDPNRWIEIAALNGLQEPYIDNVGYQLKLLVNGSKNRIIVGANKVQKLQPVTLFSEAQPRSTYTVIGISEISPSVFELTLDSGPNDDLSRFKVSQKAYVQAYLPNTVHAGQTIYIPSDVAVDVNEFNSANIPGLEQYKDLIRVSGVDFLLTSNAYIEDNVKNNAQLIGTAPVGAMDLVVDPDTGDIPLAHGETVLQQTLKLILFTSQGSLMQHPSFGVGIPVGSSIADVNLDGLRDAIQKAILADGSFSDVAFTEFAFKQGVLRIALGVRVAQLNKLLPVSFDINLRPT